MSQHTPGPWEVRYSEVSGRTVFVSQVGTPRVVADCGTAIAASVANAHLIAAAPELLEALTDMVCKRCESDICGVCGTTFRNLSGDVRGCAVHGIRESAPHPWCDRARAVIRKARGEA